MKLYKSEFIEFIITRQILKFGNFILKSGRNSPYFLNTGLFKTGKDLVLLGQFYATALIESGIDFDLLFGPAYKGIPIVTATAFTLAERYSLNKLYCFNRKEVKNYGEGGNLVGSSLQGNVVLVDDVITSGITIQNAIRTIQSCGANLIGVLVSLDRQEYETTHMSAVKYLKTSYNFKIISIITFNDLIIYLKNKPEMAHNLKKMLKYQKQFSA